MDDIKDSYTVFSQVYDEFMDNVDYEGWTEFICERLKEHGITSGLVLDLGCGTGTLTELLADRGYDMIGVDGSEDMLMSAQEKKSASGHDILYLQQDLAGFELYGTVRAIVSVCDSLNYLTEEEELARTFALVSNYLEPGGVFIFDLNTEHKYRNIIGNTTIAENRDNASFIWENSYDEEVKINEYLLTLFLRRQDGLYTRSQELHVQKAYTLFEVRMLLEKAGLSPEAVYDDYTLLLPDEETQRWTIVVLKPDSGKAEHK